MKLFFRWKITTDKLFDWWQRLTWKARRNELSPKLPEKLDLDEG